MDEMKSNRLLVSFVDMIDRVEMQFGFTPGLIGKGIVLNQSEF